MSSVRSISARSNRSGVSLRASEACPEDLPPVRKTKTPEVMRRGEVMEALGEDGEQMRLRVTGELGKGSYGTVLLADNRDSEQKVAVKVIHPKVRVFFSVFFLFILFVFFL